MRGSACRTLFQKVKSMKVYVEHWSEAKCVEVYVEHCSKVKSVKVYVEHCFRK